nr:hypothetical protein [Nitrospiraceae bacterium]
MNFDEHKKSADKFMTKDYQAMVKNLNEISKQFLNAKWYFLLTISALGLAYKYILLHPKHVFLLNPTNLIYSVIEANPSKGKIYSFTVFFVCLIGNIIFWLIGEYAVSHGFLFRTIQTRMARISKEFEDDSLRTRDPSHSSNFFENKDLKIEYFIPDQFLPFYWVGTWMILLNTILAAFLELQKNPAFNTSFIVEVLIFTLISLPFIWKLWMYYIYKMKKF